MHYVMSDVHGDYDRFMEMLSEIEFSESDRLYLVGDVIDRGKRNLEMLSFCRTRDNVTLIKGNHEYFMQLAGDDERFSFTWRRFGGRHTIHQLSGLSVKEKEEFYEYVRGLPWYVVVTPEQIPQLERPYLLTHTGFLRPSPSCSAPDFCYPDLSGLQSFDIERAVVWSSQNMPWEYSISNDLYDLPQTVRFDKRLLVGHVPVISGYVFEPVPYMLQRREYIDLDCGCGFPEHGGRLGCLRLEDMRIWYIG